MAAVQFRMVFTIEDGAGHKAQFALYGLIQDTATVSECVDQLNRAALVVIGAIDGKVVRHVLELRVDPVAQDGKPTADSILEQTGLFSYSNPTDSIKYGLAIPSFSDSLLIGGNRIDTSLDQVIAVSQLIIHNFFSVEYANQNYVSENGGALLSTALTFRKRTRHNPVASLAGITGE